MKLRWMPNFKIRDKVPNLIRLACFLVVAWVAGAALAMKVVNAEVNEIMLGLGAELMAYPGGPDREAREINLNGAKVYVRTATVDATVKESLDHYQALCEARDGSLTEQLEDMLSTHPAAPASGAKLGSISTRRLESGEAGYVACLDMGDEKRDLEVLIELFERFSKTGNLGDVGHLRYAYAKPVRGSNDTRTFLLTMWTESEVNLFKMLPMEGNDAAGRDVEGVPRPPHAQRILSSWETGQPYGVTMYGSKFQTATQLEAFYRHELPKQGWAFIESRPGESIQINGTRVIAVQKGERMISVLLNQSNEHTGLATILTSDSM